MPNFICPICRDLLILESGASVTALVCGHVFHESCIRTWLSGARSCPSCRSRSVKEGCLKLYFETTDVTTVDDVSEISQLKAKYDTVLYELNIKKETNKALSNDIISIRRLNEALRGELQSQSMKTAKFKEIVLVQNTEVKEAMAQRKLQFALTNSLAQKNDNLEAELQLLKAEVQKYSNIKEFIEGPADDLNDPDNSVDAQTLKTLLSSFKKNLKSSSESEQKLKEELRAKVLECNKYKTKYRDTKEKLRLKYQIIKNLRGQGRREESLVSAGNNITSIDNDKTKTDNGNKKQDVIKKEDNVEKKEDDDVIFVSDTLRTDFGPIVRMSKKKANQQNDSEGILVVPSTSGTSGNSMENNSNNNNKVGPISVDNTNQPSTSGTSSLSVRGCPQQWKRPRVEWCVHNSPQEFNYDGLGGHSRQELQSRSAVLKPFRLLSESAKRRK